MKTSKQPLAQIDIIETAEFIAQDDLEIALRFVDAVENSIERLRSMPKVGKLQDIRGQSGLRMWFVQGFPKSLIFYFESPEGIEIVRVIHSSRDFYRIFDEEFEEGIE